MFSKQGVCGRFCPRGSSETQQSVAVFSKQGLWSLLPSGSSETQQSMTVSMCSRIAFSNLSFGLPQPPPLWTMSEQPHPVVVRLGCAKLLLRKACGRAEHAIISRVQKSALLDFLKKHSVKEVEPGELARMVAMLQECAFVEEDKLAVMSELAPAPPHEAAKRLPMQKVFPAILDYFVAEEWSTMKQADMHTASDFLHGRIIALGGRNI